MLYDVNVICQSIVILHSTTKPLIVQEAGWKDITLLVAHITDGSLNTVDELQSVQAIGQTITDEPGSIIGLTHNGVTTQSLSILCAVGIQSKSFIYRWNEFCL